MKQTCEVVVGVTLKGRLVWEEEFWTVQRKSVFDRFRSSAVRVFDAFRCDTKDCNDLLQSCWKAEGWLTSCHKMRAHLHYFYIMAPILK